MKNKLKLMPLLMVTALVCAPLFAAKKKKATEPAAAMSPEMMQKWAAYSTPGEGHKALASLAGSFDHKIKCWMAPDAKPEESTGSTESQWILGGRFIQSKVTGMSMGQPFEGLSIVGYDNEKKQYNSLWIDSMATGFMTMEGQYDAASKTLNENGSASCPFEGTKHFRGVTKLLTENTHTFELYTNDKDGKEFKMMEINYTRRP